MSDGLSDYWAHRLAEREWKPSDPVWPWSDVRRDAPIVPRRNDIWQHIPPYFWLGREAE